MINHVHQPADTPYRASHAIYVRENAEQAFPEVGEIPAFLHDRLISVRSFDEQHMMVDGTAVGGTNLEDEISRIFADPVVAYLHLHFAGAGCFAAAVERA